MPFFDEISTFYTFTKLDIIKLIWSDRKGNKIWSKLWENSNLISVISILIVLQSNLITLTY